MIEANIWEIPLPRLNTRSSFISYNLRQLWYILLHNEDWPRSSLGINVISKKIGYELNTGIIGYEMKKLCQTGYFTREKIKQGKSVYKYTPTERFNMVQREVNGG